MKHKSLNAHMLKDKLLIYNDVNLGVAVDTDRGLMVPTVFKANRMSLNEISEVVKGLVDDCRRGAINPDLLKGGTFTVTNLGSLGVEAFTPILNPPQVAILGVNSITYKVKPIDGDFKYYPAMGLSLTFDHRAVDGAPAARFLKELANNLENFTLLLAK
jgi:pyruvate dehydrogenase E2 component (dihydrolipoamide acetyltransferase)